MLSDTVRCYGPHADEGYQRNENGFSFSLERREVDPSGVYRILLRDEDFSLSLLPSKGLSVGEVFYRGKPMFWDPPQDRLPDPEAIDVTAPLLIDGQKVEGMRWIEWFTGGVEMMGLYNWGMASRDEEGNLLALHGNVSLIPVREVSLLTDGDRAMIRGEFFVYDAHSVFPPAERSKPVYRVVKTITLFRGDPAILVEDEILNLSNEKRIPDWAYHIQLRPEQGCEFLLPSLSVENRDKSPVPPDHEIWHEAENPSRREEKGFIHKKLQWQPCFPDGRSGVIALLAYPDGSGIEVTIPRVPFLMSWFSAGGAGGENFMVPGVDGEEPRRVLEKDWNGAGPEFGVSSLDHDGNVDPEVPVRPLAPGEQQKIPLRFRFVEPDEAGRLREQIRNCSRERKTR